MSRDNLQMVFRAKSRATVEYFTFMRPHFTDKFVRVNDSELMVTDAAAAHWFLLQLQADDLADQVEVYLPYVS